MSPGRGGRAGPLRAPRRPRARAAVSSLSAPLFIPAAAALDLEVGEQLERAPVGLRVALRDVGDQAVGGVRRHPQRLADLGGGLARRRAPRRSRARRARGGPSGRAGSAAARPAGAARAAARVAVFSSPATSASASVHALRSAELAQHSWTSSTPIWRPARTRARASRARAAAAAGARRPGRRAPWPPACRCSMPSSCAWAASHRGSARGLSAVLGRDLAAGLLDRLVQRGRRLGARVLAGEEGDGQRLGVRRPPCAARRRRRRRPSSARRRRRSRTAGRARTSSPSARRRRPRRCTRRPRTARRRSGRSRPRPSRAGARGARRSGRGRRRGSGRRA